ncbi:ATP phosphoribosyltransferase regulatory subunit [hydrothermal vent metagenome]|uniref:ATP phosphoribosyltransferase regulatory subunit n=1 Tax=hydrothermal vent metagenome TaxID=652676 RepID=A0A3B1DM53_9ZZZZ
MTAPLSDRPLSPRGCINLLPGYAERKRVLESRCLDAMRKWGYREVITPIFEYLDVISRGAGEDLVESGYKLTDRQSGRVMILRPDVTPQIARIAGTALRNIRPLRLSYCLNVFRYEKMHGGRQRESFQLGAELIGIREPEGDAEIISLFTDVLRSAQLKDYRISLGQRDFLRGFWEQERLIPHIGKLKSIFVRKDTSGLHGLHKAGILTEKELRLYEEIMYLYGDEGILGKAEALVSNPVSEAALKNLQEVYGFMKTHGVHRKVIFDLSEARGFDYHTGVFFEAFIPEKGLLIGCGGRYDSLVGSFGNDSPATGFSIDLGSMLGGLKKVATQRTSILVVDLTTGKTLALRVTKELRKKGFDAIRDIIKRPFESSLEYAKLNEIKYVIKIEGAEKGEKLLSLTCTGKDSEDSGLLDEVRTIMRKFSK